MQLANNPCVEIAIVTYHRDFDTTKSLIADIKQYQYMHTCRIRLIVNDSLDHYQTLLRNMPTSNIHVYHCREFGVDLGDAQQYGWMTQQWLKLAIANIVHTPWYLVIDADQRIWPNDPVTENTWFHQGRAWCKLQRISYLQSIGSTLLPLYELSANFLGMDLYQHQYMLNDKPPVMLHTATVKQLLTEHDCTFLKRGNGTEFSLYWLYVLKKGLDKRLYRPKKDWLGFINFKEIPRQ
jgi:hypothetical protein